MSKAVLWLHGLGDTGAGWMGAFDEEVPDCEFMHPTAPRQPVTCNGGARQTSWFDIEDIPILLSEPENPAGMEETVSKVHDMLESLEKKGIPADKIIIGGFSQGGCVSLRAGLSYPKTLGGICSISGWCSTRSDMNWISEAGKSTPVLFCSGDGDPVVDFSLSKKSAELLAGELGDNIQAIHPRRPMHQPHPQEFDAVIKFMQER
mmetsp:Transcript_73358/g.130132  ORF Transcript_73358/g.130132 Transcript_73358/m.130132 type:complete len:205 (-) Transcript_73358:29-643(-)